MNGITTACVYGHVAIYDMPSVNGEDEERPAALTVATKLRAPHLLCAVITASESQDADLLEGVLELALRTLHFGGIPCIPPFPWPFEHRSVLCRRSRYLPIEESLWPH